VVNAMPPFSLRRNAIAGGCLLSRMPKPSSSCSIRRLCEMGLRQSSTIRIRLHVRAVLMTCARAARACAVRRPCGGRGQGGPAQARTGRARSGRRRAPVALAARLPLPQAGALGDLQPGHARQHRHCPAAYTLPSTFANVR